MDTFRTKMKFVKPPTRRSGGVTAMKMGANAVFKAGMAITQRFLRPQPELYVEPSSEITRVGRLSEYSMSMALTEEQRLKCWHLVYEEYLASGYTSSETIEYRYNIHDGVPGTGTFLVEKGEKAVGTVSVYHDTDMGLPADASYNDELNALREQGHRLVEVGRLAVHPEHVSDKEILNALFDILSLYARCVKDATDLVITVNPTHVRFYERMLLFERVGGEKALTTVCGAPAVLMRLDLELQKQVIRAEHGEGLAPEGYHGHTFYKFFSRELDEIRKVAKMKQISRSADVEFMYRYFVLLRPLIQQLPVDLAASVFGDWCVKYVRKAAVESTETISELMIRAN